MGTDDTKRALDSEGADTDVLRTSGTSPARGQAVFVRSIVLC